MEIQLYQCISDSNVIEKAIASVVTLEGTMRHETNILNPEILISEDLENTIALNANYAQIPAFNNRYYYVREITCVRNGLWRLWLKCDVLMSYARAIKTSQVLIDQTATIGGGGNMYLSDDSFITQVKRKTDIIPFDNGFDDTPNYILITAGGFVT